MNELNIVKEYINEIKDIYKLTIKYENLVHNDPDDDDYLFRSAILNICIKYETFTVDLYRDAYNGEKIKFNHPWEYTRQISEKLGIKNKLEYDKARKCWEFYNTLKHMNKSTFSIQKNIMQKENLSSLKDVLNWIYISIIDLLSTFVS